MINQAFLWESCFDPWVTTGTALPSSQLVVNFHGLYEHIWATNEKNTSSFCTAKVQILQGKINHGLGLLEVLEIGPDQGGFPNPRVVAFPIFDETWSKALSEMWHKTTWEWSVTWWKMVHWGCQVAIVGRLVFFRDSRSRLQARPRAPVGTILGRRKLLFPSIPSGRWSPKASKLDYNWANGHDGYDCWVMSRGFMIRKLAPPCIISFCIISDWTIYLSMVSETAPRSLSFFNPPCHEQC